MRSSIWRQPGMRPLVAMTFLGFSGYAVLLPVAPLWAVRGGADTAEAGLVNGVLLLATVLTQLLVPRALRTLGWPTVLSVGMVLLGLSGAAYAVSDSLGPVLTLSAVRGIGFGILTVTGSAAVAALVDSSRRGEAIGAYGLAVAFPNLVLLPAGPWLAENAGFEVVFAISALPLLGVPAALRLSAALGEAAPDLVRVGPAEMVSGSRKEELAGFRPLLRPTLLLLSVTLAGGAAITFAPQMVSGGLLASAGLFVMGAVAALGRWRVGRLADRHGAERFLLPLVLLTCTGSGLIAWSVADAGQSAVLFVSGMLVLGLAYGSLQNLTLVLAFGAVGRHHHNRASAVWNIGFDAGTALGSVLVGLIAVRASFEDAFWVVALLALAVLPMALRRRAG